MDLQLGCFVMNCNHREDGGADRRQVGVRSAHRWPLRPDQSSGLRNIARALPWEEQSGRGAGV